MNGELLGRGGQEAVPDAETRGGLRGDVVVARDIDIGRGGWAGDGVVDARDVDERGVAGQVVGGGRVEREGEVVVAGGQRARGGVGERDEDEVGGAGRELDEYVIVGERRRSTDRGRARRTSR